MNRTSTEVKTGLFVLLAFIGMAIIAVMIEPLKFHRGLVKGNYYLTFKNVSGLEKQAPVRVAGVTVGKVESVGVKNGKAVVKVALFKPIRIHQNGFAEIKSMGLMGEKYVEIDPGSGNYSVIPNGSTIENVRAPASMDEVVAKLGKTLDRLNSSLTTPNGKNRLALMMDNLNKMSNNLSSIMDENKDNLKLTMQNALAVSVELRSTLPTVIDNLNTLSTQLSEMALENRGDVRQIVRNMKEFSEKAPIIVDNINETTRRINELVSANTTQDISQVSENLKYSTQELHQLLAKVNNGEGTIGKLFKDKKLYENLTNATKSVGKLANRYERIRSFVGFQGDVNTRTGTTKGGFYLSLIPSPTHYYYLGVLGNSHGRVTRKEYYLENNAKRKEVERNYKTQFTLEYARVFQDRWVHKGGRLVLRGGLKESTGGIGLDYIYNNRYSLTSDLWNAGRKDSDYNDIPPDLRIGMRYNINPNFYVYFGGDDLLYHRYRGIYVGTGVRFGDKDIKYMMGSIPGIK